MKNKIQTKVAMTKQNNLRIKFKKKIILYQKKNLKYNNYQIRLIRNKLKSTNNKN